MEGGGRRCDGARDVSSGDAGEVAGSGESCDGRGVPGDWYVSEMRGEVRGGGRRWKAVEGGVTEHELARDGWGRRKLRRLGRAWRLVGGRDEGRD